MNDRIASELSLLHRELNSLDLLSRQPQKERDAANKREGAIKQRIEQIVPTPAFPVKDNGVHIFLETAEILVLRNHGSAFWSGLVKKQVNGARAYSVVVFAHMDSEFVLHETKRAAA